MSIPITLAPIEARTSGMYIHTYLVILFWRYDPKGLDLNCSGRIRYAYHLKDTMHENLVVGSGSGGLTWLMIDGMRSKLTSKQKSIYHFCQAN